MFVSFVNFQEKSDLWPVWHFAKIKLNLKNVLILHEWKLSQLSYFVHSFRFTPIFLYLVYVFPTSGRGRYCQIFANFMDNLALNWLGDERFFY